MLNLPSGDINVNLDFQKFNLENIKQNLSVKTSLSSPQDVNDYIYPNPFQQKIKVMNISNQTMLFEQTNSGQLSREQMNYINMKRSGP